MAHSGWLGSIVLGSFWVLGLPLAAHAEPPVGIVVGELRELGESDKHVLTGLFEGVGVKAVHARSVERTPERQVRVMLNLAQADIERAKAMYCDAGDEVLSHFDASVSREKNETAMLQALLAVLPKAREMGCLNHVRNDDVISVDVPVEDVPERQREALIEAARAAVTAKKVARFLAPPREPDAFHFEFDRKPEAAVKADKGE